ncbi:metallophosphoesterase [Mariniluteicoccus flavus]
MLGRLIASAAGLGAACVGYGVAVEARRFTLRRFTAPVLPAGADPVRVLHVSDLHLLPSQTAKREFVGSLAALRPDLVVNTGDNHASAGAVSAVLETYGGLLDAPGVFVWGSNDYHGPHFRNPLTYFAGPSSAKKSESAGDEPPTVELPWRELGAAFTERGWHDLTHRRAQLEVNGLRFEFRGTDDAHIKRDRYAEVAGPAAPGADVSVGVTHAPYLRVLDAMAVDGVDAIFAGHTHGGQVCVPGYGALVTNCDIERARVKGLSTHTAGGHTAALHVSGGLGMSPFAPYRFACPPEATLLTLTARDADVRGV